MGGFLSESMVDLEPKPLMRTLNQNCFENDFSDSRTRTINENIKLDQNHLWIWDGLGPDMNLGRE